LKPKKVQILIEDGKRYDPSVKNRAEYTSVWLTGNMNYGGGSPCDNDQEIKKAIDHFKEWAIKEGDIPEIIDNRKKPLLDPKGYRNLNTFISSL